MSRKSKSKKRILMRLATKSFFRRVKSRLKRKLYRGGKLSDGVAKKYHIKNQYYVQRRISKTEGLKTLEINIPEKFCFFRDPVGTTKFFRDLRKELNKGEPRNIFISHENTKEIGLAASYLFDRLIKELKNRWQKYRISINFSGRISELKKVNNFLLSFGLLKELNIGADKFSANKVDFDYGDKYLTLKKEGSKFALADKSKASTALVDYFDNCLKHNGFEIDYSAKMNLIDRIGEIIGNAEEHCGNEEGKWFTLGCYDKDEHNCSFAIINYGNTIYENLSDEASTAAEVIEKVKKVIDKQKPTWEKVKGIIFQPKDEEPIWTVMALQDGISSKRTISGPGSTRGQGIMDVLSFVELVKSPKKIAEIFLLSGHAEIIIDYKYPIVTKLVGPTKEPRRIIAFNKENDLHQLQDDTKVIYLEDKFEGAIFSGSFKIDDKYLKTN